MTAFSIKIDQKAKKLIWQIAIGVVLAVMVITVLGLPTQAAAQKRGAPENPYRAAYVSAREYWAFVKFFSLFRDRLEIEGWGSKVAFPGELKLILDDYESPEAKNAAVSRLLDREDIDLVLSLGTEATQYVLNNNSQGRPVLGCSISNPISSFLIEDAEYSTKPNFTTVIFNNSLANNMFAIFHQFLGFKKLGIVYADNEFARSYSFLNEAREVARDRGFELLEYDRLDSAESYESCVRGVQDLVQRGIDALFITNTACFDTNSNNLKELYTLLYDNHIITLAAEDFDQVRLYALFGYIFMELSPIVIEFQVNQAIKILSGKKTNEIPIKVNAFSQYVINLAAAERLNLIIDDSLLIFSDILFLDLKGME
ncbi:MAG: ABC transporter substrate-binding protein [Deltaproteobacteria bacterium]|jgi:ABC-type uncharacterized transport system substrate-binding protein|nr:ABC transporter substrate-binding protein [Deltaproteobacteria bacterium]